MASTSRNRRNWIPFANSDLIRNLPNLFFFRRHPFNHIPKQWERPEAEADYQQLLEWEGFVTVDGWGDDNLQQYPVIAQDLIELEEHLLPTFWEFNQKAKHFQNNFYFYQWVFIIGAFLTTVAAILTAYFQSQPVQIIEREVPAITTQAEADDAAAAAEADRREVIIDTTWSDTSKSIGSVLSWITLGVSLLTTYSATMTNHGEPRKKWNNYRRLTEELRMTYYKYLSHLEPFDKSERVTALRARILEIRRKEQDNNG
jgi:hypothetical protein